VQNFSVKTLLWPNVGMLQFVISNVFASAPQPCVVRVVFDTSTCMFCCF